MMMDHRNKKVDLLDHGFLRLIDYMGNDLSIVRNARTSHDAAWRAGQDQGGDTRLLNFLMGHGHNTPFEAVEVQFEVKAPIFVFRQWHRHRVQSYNEVSARYTELPEEYYIPKIEHIGKQHNRHKQMRIFIEELTDDERRMREEEIHWVQEHCYQSFKLYHKLLERGWPREVARMYLPFATYSKMFAKTNLHNWFRFCHERCHPTAQYEIQVFANEILNMLELIAPVAVRCFKSVNQYT